MNYITHKVNYLNKILQHNCKTVSLISRPEFFCSVPIKHMTNGFNTSLAPLAMITPQPPEPLKNQSSMLRYIVTPQLYN